MSRSRRSLYKTLGATRSQVANSLAPSPINVSNFVWSEAAALKVAILLAAGSAKEPCTYFNCGYIPVFSATSAKRTMIRESLTPFKVAAPVSVRSGDTLLVEHALNATPPQGAAWPLEFTLKLEPRAAAQSVNTSEAGVTKPPNSTINESKTPLPFSSFV